MKNSKIKRLFDLFAYMVFTVLIIFTFTHKQNDLMFVVIIGIFMYSLVSQTAENKKVLVYTGWIVGSISLLLFFLRVVLKVI